MTQPFTTLNGVAAPFLESNVSTNVISVQKAHGPGGAEEGVDCNDLFSGLRFDRDGREQPGFVLNRAPFRDARFLITGANFGCGSSREAAVHALVAFGIRAVIAPSFGDIFFANCFKNGVLPVMVSAADALALAGEAESGGRFTADLPANTLSAPSGRKLAIQLPEFRRQQLLEGLDEVGLTLRRAGEIDAYYRARRDKYDWIYALR